MGWFWASKEDDSSKKSCPVDHKTPTPAALSSSQDSKCPVDHTKLQQQKDSKCPVDHTKLLPQQKEHQESKCPVPHEQRSSWFSWGKQASNNTNNNATQDHSSDKLNPMNNMPDLSAQRAPGQQLFLPTERTQSTIPRGSTDTEGVWEYPSPQQMFNAMLRKSGSSDGIPEDAVESMVDVHNFLNEGAWREVAKWEQPYTEGSGKEPRLLKFQGRPDEMSPRAAWIQFLGKVYPSKYGCQPPFDRHDWTVLRGVPGSDERQKVRYVIDFYAGPDEDNDSPSFILDVRPALDSVGSAIDRFHRAAGPVWNKAMGKDGEN